MGQSGQECSTHWCEREQNCVPGLADKSCQVFLQFHWEAQDPELGADLASVLWPSSAGFQLLLVSIRISLGVGKAIQGGSTCHHTCGLDLGVDWAELSCSTYGWA